MSLFRRLTSGTTFGLIDNEAALTHVRATRIVQLDGTTARGYTGESRIAFRGGEDCQKTLLGIPQQNHSTGTIMSYLGGTKRHGNAFQSVHADGTRAQARPTLVGTVVFAIKQHETLGTIFHQQSIFQNQNARTT